MRWDRGYESSNIEDRRGQPAPLGGGGVPIGGIINLLSIFGWKGIVVGLIIAAVLAVGGTCMGGNGCLGMGGGEQRATDNRPVSESGEENDLRHFIGYVFDDVQNTWRGQLDGYEVTKLVLFRRGVKSACGTASTAVGPFYCPLDHNVYIDLSFYEELRARYGAPGDFAQAYVIAHELGHHVQNLTGKLGKGSVDSVRTELQADCLAGAWAKDANRRNLVEVGDIDEALNAASQIGDDTLQRKTQGHVQPETWTHGSAAQRSSSFRKGYDSGRQACGI
jgi:predicted metalloprotease